MSTQFQPRGDYADRGPSPLAPARSPLAVVFDRDLLADADARDDRFVVVRRSTVGDLKALLPAVTRQHLMLILGISETTWCKLRDGKPIKRTTWNRLLARREAHRARPGV
ncbi:MAG: hypothetical protein JWP92_2939 [Caulobacter sp.]|nr:hypothetical protein [Caulobacter sp.]